MERGLNQVGVMCTVKLTPIGNKGEYYVGYFSNVYRLRLVDSFVGAVCSFCIVRAHLAAGRFGQLGPNVAGGYSSF